MTEKIFKEAVLELRRILEPWTGNIYLVGGCVRDQVLGIIPKDIDIIIDIPEGTSIVLDWLKQKQSDICHGFTEFPRYKTGKFSLILPSGSEVDIECVVPRTESYGDGPRKPDKVEQGTLYQDVMRRDFCCNSLYQDLWTSKILDLTENGILHCEKRLLQPVSDPKVIFKDDPLRMLRAIRFAITKGFTLSPICKYGLTEMSAEIEVLSLERIRDEFVKVLMSPRASEGIRMFKEYDQLRYIIPELNEYWEFDQNSKYHDLNLGDHLMKVLDKVTEANPKASLELRLAAILHDIAKPECYQTRPDGTYSFIYHDIDSSREAETILQRLRFPNDTVSKVKFYIANHMCIKQDATKNEGGLYSYSGKPKRTRKLLRILGDSLIDVMDLIDADNLSHAPAYCMPGQVQSFLLQAALLDNIDSPGFTMDITGKDIMSEFDVQGRVVGDIKKICQEIYDEFPGLPREEIFMIYRARYSDGLTDPMKFIRDQQTGIAWEIAEEIVSGLSKSSEVTGKIENLGASISDGFLEIKIDWENGNHNNVSISLRR